MSKQKKSSRPNLPEQTLARARAELYGEEAVEVVQNGGNNAPAAVVKRKYVPAVTIEELKGDYAYVLLDLRNMFLLASVLVAAMIVIALIIF